jgi:hypothetical protein
MGKPDPTLSLPSAPGAHAGPVLEEVLANAQREAAASVRGGKRPGIRCELEIVVRDAEGNVVETRRKPDDLFTVAFLNLFAAAVGNVAVATYDVTHTSRVIGGSLPQIVFCGPVGLQEGMEIAFGTGTTPAAFTDYAIETSAGGTNPVVIATPTSPVSSSNSFTYAATWTNSTGSSVTVSEVATYWISTAAGSPYIYGSNEWTFCITHDTFTGVAVPNSGTATATYTWTFS